MKPPYDITPRILNLIRSISEKIGEVNAGHLNRQSPQLRKDNRVKTIHASLQIEGNTLSEEQITALIDNKNVVGPPKDIQEVFNAIQVYENIKNYKYTSAKSFLKAHADLMKHLLKKPGQYRKHGVGIVKGTSVSHVAPPFQNVPFLMDNLFDYLKNDEDLILIKSCVFHYELEFIHPFIDGNGRMGRLWQTLILLQEYPVFEYLPFETLIKNNQHAYYHALSVSDKMGKSTPFIEYMLEVIDRSLDDLLNYNNRILKDSDRLEYYTSMGKSPFSRKDYMDMFKDISSSTASRDLKKGLEMKLLKSKGKHNRTVYVVR
jgi:Fic family protein